MKILLIMPTFYNYYKLIRQKLEEDGHEVFYYPDEIDLNVTDRIYRKLDSNSLNDRFDKYIENISREVKFSSINKVVLIFGGRYFRPKHIDFLREQCRNAVFIYYAWDSISNFPNIKEFYNKFDFSFSFDKEDCENYNMRFHPLFYSNIYDNKVEKYDYSAIMTFGKNKAKNYYTILSKIPKDMKGFQYLVMRSRTTFMYNLLMYPQYFLKIIRYIHFKPLNLSQVNDVVARSKVIIDCPLEGQNGLTMRTFEVLNSKRKLITTNKSIKDYDFYCSDNIVVVDESLQMIPETFFESEYNQNYQLGEKYSLDSFIQDIIYLKGNI